MNEKLEKIMDIGMEIQELADQIRLVEGKRDAKETMKLLDQIKTALHELPSTMKKEKVI